MTGFRRGSRPLAEEQAAGATARIYHDIRQTLRVTGVAALFRVWEAHGWLPVLWEAVKPVVETRAFEEAADRLRAQGVRAAAAIGRLGAAQAVDLGESERYRLLAALDVYHYMNPKLLLVTASTLLVLRGESPSEPEPAHPVPVIPRGAPARMHPLEMLASRPTGSLRMIFDRIRSGLGLADVPCDYRTLALWPDYLEEAWGRLDPLVRQPDHRRAAEQLREAADAYAMDLRWPALGPDRLRAVGVEPGEIDAVTEALGQAASVLTLNIALLELDWREPDLLARSPFPAPGASAEVETP